jgi:glycosyltransferase involved in cell wall biosynthesis
MRILFVSFINDSWGGSEVLWSDAAEVALARGHQVAISAIAHPTVAPRIAFLQKAGAFVDFRLGYVDARWHFRKRIAMKAWYLLRNRIRGPFAPVLRWKPDLIVFTGGCYAIVENYDLVKFSQEKNIPLVLNNQVNIEYTRPLSFDSYTVLRRVYDDVALATFVSERNLKVVERHLAQNLRKAIVLRNPVNLTSSTIVPWPDSEHGFRMAIVANVLVNHKGHDLLLEVFGQEKWRARPITLHIYGRGKDEEYIHDLIEFYGLKGRVFLEGVAQNIREVWAKNHLMVLPSLNEGMPLAVVEAMLCGRPVVATDVGGNTEWIAHGVEGFIAPGANTPALDETLELAWQRRGEWEEMGLKAHNRASIQHDEDAGQTFLENIVSAAKARNKVNFC